MDTYSHEGNGLLALFLDIRFASAQNTKADVKGEMALGRRRGVMSDQLKMELAKELGFYDVVQEEGWGGIKARDAGNMVKRAIEMAERQLGQSNNREE